MLRSLVAGTRNLRISPATSIRQLRTFAPLYNDKNTGSLFGEVTEHSDREDSTLNMLSNRMENSEIEKDEKGDSKLKLPKSDQQLAQDPQILKLTHPDGKSAAEQLLSPLKRQLYELAMKTGGYDPKKIYTLDGRKYELKLTKEELQALEPSLYLKSFRVKSSTKKTYPFLRMLRNMPLKEAITQCHFSAKLVARDVAEMLTRGVKDAQRLGLNPDELYLNQIWVGKDGGNYKRLDFKARGKVGIIEHKYVHVRAILKTLESREKFLDKKRTREMSRTVKQQLTSRPIHEIAPSQDYKW